MSIHVTCQAGKCVGNEIPRNSLTYRELLRDGAYDLPMPTLGQNIREARKRAKLERRELTAALGLAAGSSTVADLEANRNPDIGIQKLLRVAKSLRVSVEHLLAGVDDGYDELLSDLLRQTSTGPSPSEVLQSDRDGEHVAQARVLQQQIDHARSELDAIRVSITRLLDDLSDRQEPQRPQRPQARTRRVRQSSRR